MRQYHPDVNKSNAAATEKFKEVQEAYDVLSDAQRRKQYDQFGHAGPTGAPPGGDPFEAFRRSQAGRAGQHAWRPSPGVTVEDYDFGGGGDFGSIFEQLFGGAARGAGPRGRARPQPRPERGEDVEYGVTISFEQAARGTTVPLQINRDGRVETIEIKIPPGVKDGSRIRLRGKGQESPGGEAGDLYIVTHVQPHPYYRREGLDIYVDLPLSFSEAMLGTKVDVPTLDGPVTMTIPPCTSSGARLRIKGRGIERGSEKGDEYAVVKIIVPKHLDDEDKQLVQKLAAKHSLHPRANIGW